MLLAGNCENSNDDGNQERPDKARHSVEPVAQQLQRKTAGIIICNVITENGEGEKNKAELRPPHRVIDLPNQTSEPVIRVRIGVGWVCCCYSGVAETGTDDNAEGGWNGYTPEGEGKNFPGFCIGGVVAIIVRSN